MSTHFVNGTAARDALFGSGAQDAKQLISKVIIGGTGMQNPYPNMRKVLGALGVSLDPQVINHNSHFHVYLNPPKVTNIGPSNLLTDSASLAVRDSTILSELLGAKTRELLGYVETLTTTGEELMFTMDVPYVPTLEAPIVLAQAANNTSALKPDYQLTICQETESTGDPRSALRAVDPAGMLIVYLENYKHRKFAWNAEAAIKLSLLEGPTHGKLTSGTTDGQTYYGYNAEPNYVGNDKAIFMAEFEGKRYKIVVNLVVSLTVGETPLMSSEKPVCPPWKLIKVNGKSVSDASSYRLNSFTVTFGDLDGGAVGQTSGTDVKLDTNAAGHNWYIDPTPLDNSDDYLPTSDSTVWQAKTGSAAAGKMDMLSVLLHEYGHALGLEHSANGADFMAASLQPGVRKLPSSEELALMARLVAELKGADGEALTLALSQGEWGQVQGETKQDPANPFEPSPLSALGLLPLGFMRRNGGKGSANAGVAMGAATHTDYLTAINTTLTNGSFGAGQNGTIDQWESVGNVAATPAAGHTGSGLPICKMPSLVLFAPGNFVTRAGKASSSLKQARVGRPTWGGSVRVLLI
jgi:Matrixin